MDAKYITKGEMCMWYLNCVLVCGFFSLQSCFCKSFRFVLAGAGMVCARSVRLLTHNNIWPISVICFVMLPIMYKSTRKHAARVLSFSFYLSLSSFVRSLAHTHHSQSNILSTYQITLTYVVRGWHQPCACVCARALLDSLWIFN